MTKARHRLFTWRGLLLSGWQVAMIVLIALVIYPVEIRAYRLSAIALFLVGWIGLLVVCWRWPRVRDTLLGVTVLVVGFLLMPGRGQFDREALAQNCAEAMRRYEGSPYVWGGEKLWGIDCSGLVRRGMIDSLLWQGISTLNPSLVRQGVFLWWNDTTARDMGMGGDQTAFLFETGSINSLDHSTLRPGDMAVTKSGVHILGYLGNQTWIEADPGAGKVLIAQAPSETNLWLKGPVKIIRWDILQPK